MAQPAFIADAMLGRLATWLRILGYDVDYEPAWDDVTLCRRTVESGRVLLTRDLRLLRQNLIRGLAFEVRGDHYGDQLRQVVVRFGLNVRDGLFTRCLRCNGILTDVDKSAVAGRVAAYVFATQDKFTGCPNCGRIYWPATHRARMEEHLQRILKAEIR